MTRHPTIVPIDSAWRLGFDAGLRLDLKISDCPYPATRASLRRDWMHGFGRGRARHVQQLLVRLGKERFDPARVADLPDQATR